VSEKLPVESKGETYYNPGEGRMFKDRMIQCIQCGKPFLFTAADQERFFSRGFDVPRRCYNCRKKKSKLGNSSEADKVWMKKDKPAVRKRRLHDHEEVW